MPDYDPIVEISEEYPLIKQISLHLPDLISSSHARELIDGLPMYSFDEINVCDLERTMQAYSYLASAYVWGNGEDGILNYIPENVSMPLIKLSSKLERPPILSYASYCLNNWKIKDKIKPICVDNLELIQKFTNLRDEEWFILIHIDIENHGSYVLKTIDNLMFNLTAIFPNEFKIYQNLLDLHISLKNINATMLRMPEQCSPDVYYKKVRPYIFGFNNVVYRGCFNEEPQTFRGETGAQSSLIPAIQIVLGVKHTDSMLTDHLNDMRKYMPKEHRELLNKLETFAFKENNLVDFVKKSTNCNMKDGYNQCVTDLWKFRDIHYNYAEDYIAKKVDGDRGTGGTPYIQWLKKLCDETLAHIIK